MVGGMRTHSLHFKAASPRSRGVQNKLYQPAKAWPLFSVGASCFYPLIFAALCRKTWSRPISKWQSCDPGWRQQAAHRWVVGHNRWTVVGARGPCDPSPVTFGQRCEHALQRNPLSAARFPSCHRKFLPASGCAARVASTVRHCDCWLQALAHEAEQLRQQLVATQAALAAARWDVTANRLASKVICSVLSAVLHCPQYLGQCYNDMTACRAFSHCLPSAGVLPNALYRQSCGKLLR